MNKFYATGTDRAARVQDLFAAVAPRYDLINDLQSLGLHRWWKRRMIRLAAPSAGMKVLDLCCGTGDVALAFGQRGAEVTGLDFSPAMLEIADKRLSQAKVSEDLIVDFIQGDAQNLPFEDGSFDIVTISYGLRNLADWRKGLEEMIRVTRPGGRILVLDFGKPDNWLLRAAYFAYLQYAVPVLGKLFCGDADTHGYILESLRVYPAQRGVEAGMKERGLLNSRIIHLVGGAMSINYAEKPKFKL